MMIMWTISILMMVVYSAARLVDLRLTDTIYLLISLINFLFFSALRIHVSPECKEILDELGGYHLENRGEVEMKVNQPCMSSFLNLISQNRSIPKLGH